MKECAFCLNEAKMSGEHVFSHWMNEALAPAIRPGKWTRTFNRPKAQPICSHSANLDWTIKTVCEPCNTGWMSIEIEGKRARPTMSPLIAGRLHVPLTSKDAQSMAIFAFKTAVIVDRLRNDGVGPFFSKRICYAFKQSLAIPPMIGMWLCAYAPAGGRRADVFAGYYSGKVPLIGDVEFYVCTYGIGYLAFQVLSVKTISRGAGFQPISGFEKLSVPFWPEIPEGFVWPLRYGLRSVEELGEFHRRWRTITPMI